MKTMIIVDKDNEVALVERLWNQMIEEKRMGYIDGLSYVSGDLGYNDRGSADMIFGPNAIVYHYVHVINDEGYWDVYNFETGKRERVEGDLAGLTNTSDGMFPFFN